MPRRKEIELWSEFYEYYQKLESNPPFGSSRNQVAEEFSKQFGQWKKKFLGRAEMLKKEWQIYFHILEAHAADVY